LIHIEDEFRRGFPLTRQVASSVDETTIRAFLDALDRHCSGYCVLGGYEELPATIDTDIDFIVSERDFERLPEILRMFAEDIGYRLILEIKHRTGRRYEIVKAEPGCVFYLSLDPCSAYYRHESWRCWLTAEALLERRRWDAKGFWVPAAADAFITYFIKRIGKRSLEDRHIRHLGRLFSDDELGCTEALQLRLPRKSAEMVAAAGRSCDWKPVIEAIKELDRELVANATGESTRSKLRDVVRLVRRWIQPTGLFVAVIGQAGSGKTSVIEQYLPAFGTAFRQTLSFQLRPRLLSDSVIGQAISSATESRKPGGSLAFAVHLLALSVDYALGYIVRIRPSLVRSGLVVFDGYYYDLLFGVQRFRSGGLRWLAKLICPLIPMPDLVLVLNAPMEVLQSRGLETSAGESTRRADEYRAFAETYAAAGRVATVHAARPLDEVIYECVDKTLVLLQKRTAKRLHLD